MSIISLSDDNNDRIDHNFFTEYIDNNLIHNEQLKMRRKIDIVYQQNNNKRCYKLEITLKELKDIPFEDFDGMIVVIDKARQQIWNQGLIEIRMLGRIKRDNSPSFDKLTD